MWKFSLKTLTKMSHLSRSVSAGLFSFLHLALICQQILRIAVQTFGVVASVLIAKAAD